MTPDGVDVRRVRTAGERLDAYVVRRNVFQREQQVPEEIERDALDESAEHVVAYVDGVAAGAGRLVIEGEAARVGRMAVRAPARGRGLGTAVLACLEAIAVERNCRSVVLHAQLAAAPFYRRLGYTEEGDVFVEAGIEHVTMRKALVPPL